MSEIQGGTQHTADMEHTFGATLPPYCIVDNILITK